MAGRKGKKHHEEEEAGEAWLLPYSDLMTLLLAVFIVLFAVSKVDESKASSMAESFQSSMTVGGAGMMENDGTSLLPMFNEGTPIEPLEQSPEAGSEAGSETQQQPTPAVDQTGQEGITLAEQQEMNRLIEVKEELEKFFEAAGMERDVTMHIDERGLVISLNSAILFDSGSADIKSENESILLKIALTINRLDNNIRIEGHTDNIPINTLVYPSNWELSGARAARVVRFYADQARIDTDKLSLVGYGENKPVADNDTEEGRAKNRRIDIIILNTKYNSLED